MFALDLALEARGFGVGLRAYFKRGVLYKNV